jgi:SAM-dependent methyltransferase
MRTPLGSDNPHSASRYGFAWEMVPSGGAAHLDFGCYDGAFLASLRSKRIGRLVGIDANSEALATGRAEYPELELIHQREPVPLLLGDGAFSSITILDVLEHVVEQEPLLREFHRVLAAEGVLIVTVPGQYLLSFLDLGNLKFRFPRLHRWWYCRTHSRAEYERRYVANPDGMIGDISAEKAWHEHFSRSKLAALLGRTGFAVERFDGTAFFTRAMAPLRLTVGRLRPAGRALDRLARWDARTFSSMNLFCAARKR